VAALVKLKILDEGEVLYLLQHRIITVWNAIAPYVLHERSTSKQKLFLGLLERLYLDATNFSKDSYKGARSWRVPQSPPEESLISPGPEETPSNIS